MTAQRIRDLVLAGPGGVVVTVRVLVPHTQLAPAQRDAVLDWVRHAIDPDAGRP